MKAEIVNFIAATCQPSFADLMSLPGFAGEEVLGCPDAGIVLWHKISRPAADAIIDLLHSGEIDVGHAHIDVYLHADNFFIPDFPLALARGPYEHPHWVPILFKIPQQSSRLQ